MKISLLIQRIVNIAGGAERVVVNVANQLVQQGHDVEILSFETTLGRPFYHLNPAVKYRNLGISFLSGRSISERWKKRLTKWTQNRSGNPLISRLAWKLTYQTHMDRLEMHLSDHPRDLLVAFLPSTFTIAAGVASKMDIPYILSCHNVPEQDFESPDRWDQNPVEKRHRLAALEHATAITVILPEFKEWFPEKIRRKVHVIRNFISRPTATYPSIEERRKRILAVGRYCSQKDHAVLIRAWKLIHDQFPDWTIEIYGEGLLKNSTTDLIAELSLESCIFLNPPTDDIWSLYGNSQIFCIPSKFEGFGLVTVEAMACGTPAIGFQSCPGTNRLIQHDQTGLLVECDDAGKVEALAQALERLIKDPLLRNKFSTLSLEEAESYFVENRIQDWFDLIDSIKTHTASHMNRPRLILHIGTHKTGTTGIQKFCASNRDVLLQQGVLYPSYSLIGEKNHYAHHSIAHGIAAPDPVWTHEKITEFLKTTAERCPAGGEVLISAEPFYRHFIAKDNKRAGSLMDTDYWNRRSQYIESVATYFEGFEVEVVVVFRRQADFFNSLYQEMIKATRFSGSAFEFFLIKRHEFLYFAQIEAWAKYFPNIRALLFEDLVAENNLVPKFLNEAGGRPLELPEITSYANESLDPTIVEIKRLINSVPDNVSKAFLTSVNAGALQKLQKYALKNGIIGEVRKQSYLTKSEAQLLSISCREENQQLSRKYFADGNSKLEEGPAKSSTFNTVSHELSAEVVSHLIAKLTDIVKADPT